MPSIDIHVRVQAARLFVRELALPGGLEQVQRPRGRGEEPERVEVAAPHPVLRQDGSGVEAQWPIPVSDLVRILPYTIAHSCMPKQPKCGVREAVTSSRSADPRDRGAAALVSRPATSRLMPRALG